MKYFVVERFPGAMFEFFKSQTALRVVTILLMMN